MIDSKSLSYLLWWAVHALASIASYGQEIAEPRVYWNRLTKIQSPRAILADYPEFFEPIIEQSHFLAPAIVEDPEADLDVRAWRFSYNARGIIEMPNRLRGDQTAIIMVHPWAIDDSWGWKTPQPHGVADFCTPSGTATVSHFAGEWFKSVAGIRMVHVPYRGSGPAMNDLIGRHIPFLIDTAVAARPQIEAGRVRALAVTSATRSSMLPDVPTLQELGFPGIDLSSWVALVTASGIPAEAKARLGEALAAIMADPSNQAEMRRLGFDPLYRVIADWPGEIGREIETMRGIATAANIQPE